MGRSNEAWIQAFLTKQPNSLIDLLVSVSISMEWKVCLLVSDFQYLFLCPLVGHVVHLLEVFKCTIAQLHLYKAAYSFSTELPIYSHI